MELGHTASQDEIASAYKRLRIKRHPDKPEGSKEAFQDLQDAHAVLSDPKKREIYDSYGKEGIERLAQTEPSVRPPRRKIQPIQVRVDLDLEEAFRAHEKTVRFQRIVVDGPRRSRVEVSEKVHIPKGVLDGHRITLSEKGHEDGSEKGDVIVEVSFLPHDTFRLEGFELLIEREVSLRLALLGGRLNLPCFSDEGRLDSRLVTVPPRLILKQPGLISVPHSGMPLGSQDQRGDLVVRCTVDLGALTSSVFSTQLQRMMGEELPSKEGEEDAGSPSGLLRACSAATPFDKAKAEARVRWAHEYFGTDEEDEMHGPQVVQCAQQ
jgi:curved DNA-binding protein